MTADSVSFINEHFVCAAADGQNTYVYIYHMYISHVYMYVYVFTVWIKGEIPTCGICWRSEGPIVVDDLMWWLPNGEKIFGMFVEASQNSDFILWQCF